LKRRADRESAGMKIVIGLRHTAAHNGGDMAAMLDMVRLADRKGIHGLEISDHLVMAEVVDGKYPYGKPQIDKFSYFYEPLTMLAAYAAVTTQIRFSTHIMVAPMRSAILLAKQVATLDLVASGRLDLGFGTGWQQEEFELTPGVPFDKRFGYMDEQVGACRAIWSGGPARFAGQHIAFENIYAYPLPVQGGAVPVLYGMKPTERNVARIGAIADGWLPDPGICEPDTLSPHVEALRAAFVANGRDPARLMVGVMPRPLRAEGAAFADLDATLAQLPGLKAAGATHAHLYPFQFGGAEDYERFLDQLVAAQG
jgi:probable F420-dependent oxidoreductase